MWKLAAPDDDADSMGAKCFQCKTVGHGGAFIAIHLLAHRIWFVQRRTVLRHVNAWFRNAKAARFKQQDEEATQITLEIIRGTASSVLAAFKKRWLGVLTQQRIRIWHQNSLTGEMRGVTMKVVINQMINTTLQLQKSEKRTLLKVWLNAARAHGRRLRKQRGACLRLALIIRACERGRGRNRLVECLERWLMRHQNDQKRQRKVFRKAGACLRRAVQGHEAKQIRSLIWRWKDEAHADGLMVTFQGSITPLTPISNPNPNPNPSPSSKASTTIVTP